MLQRLFELELRMPAWLRPTYRGALFILGMSFGVAGKLFVLIMLATLMLLAGAARGLGLFLGLLGVAMLAGAAAGTIHGILRPVENWGRTGVWLRWALSIFGYVIAFQFFAPDSPFSLQDGAFFVIAAGISTLGAGCLVLLDDRRPGRPLPREFQVLQSRKRLWAAADRARAHRRGADENPLRAASLHEGVDPEIVHVKLVSPHAEHVITARFQ